MLGVMVTCIPSTVTVPYRQYLCLCVLEVNTHKHRKWCILCSRVYYYTNGTCNITCIYIRIMCVQLCLLTKLCIKMCIDVFITFAHKYYNSMHVYYTHKIRGLYIQVQSQFSLSPSLCLSCRQPITLW